MNSNLDALFKTNTEMEKSGIWFEVTPEIRFKLRRFGGSNSVIVDKAMSKHHKPYARLIENKSLPEDKIMEIMAKVFYESSLVEWEGVEIDGRPAECNMANAVKLFTKLPDLFDALLKYSQGVDSFREELGNSSKAMLDGVPIGAETN